MVGLGLLILRIGLGLTIAAHGAQPGFFVDWGLEQPGQGTPGSG
jgi:hypothetical protein